MSNGNGQVFSVQPRLQDREKRPEPQWFWSLWEFANECDVPPWGHKGRTAALREAVQVEPILSGAISSMLAKATSLDWQIIGGRNRVRRYHQILAEAEDGQGWTYFLDRLLFDYWCSDLGGFVELGRDGRTGPVLALYNIDAARLAFTKSRAYPLIYYPATSLPGISGKGILLSPLDFFRIVDMPSPDETKYGLGFCAVSRALRAAKVLMALYNYESEQLEDMPIPGIVSITGMTQAEVKAAFKLYEEMRKSKRQVTFKGLLWLAAQSSPINPISVNFTPFANLPESFDREQVLTHYVYTLALDFGVDVREFWPASQTGATKAEAEIQAQKAKGKGFGRMLSVVERAINWQVLPEGLEFAFDQKDSEDDLLREKVRAAAIANVRKLWEPSPLGEGIISTAEARRWLVELEAAPAWLAGTDESRAYGSENMPEDEMETPGAALENEVLAGMVEKARLQPGEDLVAINRAGDMVTLWRPAYFYVPDWPLPASFAQTAVQSSLTTEDYP